MKYEDPDNPSVITGQLEFVVTAHNSEDTIEACVLALLAVRRASRVTVINDSSRDRTHEILAAIDNERLRVLNVEFRSRAKASNLGFRDTIAEFVCSVDSDVLFVNNRFEELLPLLDAYPLLMLTEDSTDTSPRRTGWDQDFAEPRNAFLFSRRHLPGLHFSELYPKAGAEDTDMAIRLLKAGVSLASVYGGYVHERVEGSMGWRRRVHFHVWNVITYLRHLDVPMCRRRLLEIARHPVQRAVRSVKQELGKQS
jgi:glycosyltransferase involved in cell wall biosynthesis